MTLVIANLNNLAIGLTSFHLLWINCVMLPQGVASPLVPTGRSRRLWFVLPGDGPPGLHDQTTADVERNLAHLMDLRMSEETRTSTDA